MSRNKKKKPSQWMKEQASLSRTERRYLDSYKQLKATTTILQSTIQAHADLTKEFEFLEQIHSKYLGKKPRDVEKKLKKFRSATSQRPAHTNVPKSRKQAPKSKTSKLPRVREEADPVVASTKKKSSPRRVSTVFGLTSPLHKNKPRPSFTASLCLTDDETHTLNTVIKTHEHMRRNGYVQVNGVWRASQQSEALAQKMEEKRKILNNLHDRFTKKTHRRRLKTVFLKGSRYGEPELSDFLLSQAEAESESDSDEDARTRDSEAFLCQGGKTKKQWYRLHQTCEMLLHIDELDPASLAKFRSLCTTPPSISSYHGLECHCIDLQSCGLSDKDLELLSTSLSRPQIGSSTNDGEHPWFEPIYGLELNLSNNSITDEGCLILAKTIAAEPSIVSVILSKNSITTEGAQILAKAARSRQLCSIYDSNLPTLGKLVLEENQLTRETLQEILHQTLGEGHAVTIDEHVQHAYPGPLTVLQKQDISHVFPRAAASHYVKTHYRKHHGDNYTFHPT